MTDPNPPNPPPLQHQRIYREPSVHGWTETRIDTLNTYGQVDSETTLRWRQGWRFIDIEINERTGISRRAKLTSVRLDEAAARELFNSLAAVLGEKGGHV